MLEGSSGDITERVFKKVSSLYVHQEKSIPVSTDGCIRAIYNIIMKDVTKEGGWIGRMFVSTFLG